MANISKLYLEYTGKLSVLEDVKNQIINEDKKQINFSIVENSVPLERDEKVFKSLNIDYMKYIQGLMTKEDKKIADNILEKYLKHYVGLRDEYINERNYDVIGYIKDNKLIIEGEFAWYSPIMFFNKIAELNKLNFEMIEKTEGNFTDIYYNDENYKIKNIQNSNKNILNSQTFREKSIKLKLHKPREIALLGLMSNKSKIVMEMIANYGVNLDEICFAIKDIVKDYKDDNMHDIYQESPYVNLEEEVLNDMANNELSTIMKYSNMFDKVEKSYNKKIKKIFNNKKY